MLRSCGVYNLTRHTEKVLKRTRKEAPSLMMHLFTDYFRLGDNNDVRHSYDGELKGWITFIREQRIPNELLDVLDEAGVRFFDGCLIVEVYDHRSGEKGKGDIKTPPGGAKTVAGLPASAEQPDLYRILLTPTGETLWRDLQLMNELKAVQWAAPSAKKKELKWKPLTESEAVEVEAAIIERTSPALCLAPTLITSRIANQMLAETTLFNPREELKVRKRPPDPAEEEAKRRKRERRERFINLGDESYGSGFAPSFTRFDKIVAIRKGQAASAADHAAHSTATADASQPAPSAADASTDSIPVHGRAGSPPSLSSTPGGGASALSRKTSVVLNAAGKKRVSGGVGDVGASGIDSPSTSILPKPKASTPPAASSMVKLKAQEMDPSAEEKKRKKAEQRQRTKEKKAVEAKQRAEAMQQLQQRQQQLSAAAAAAAAAQSPRYPPSGIPVPQNEGSIPVPSSLNGGSGLAPNPLEGATSGGPYAYSDPNLAAYSAYASAYGGGASAQQNQQVGIPVPQQPIPQTPGGGIPVPQLGTGGAGPEGGVGQGDDGLAVGVGLGNAPGPSNGNGWGLPFFGGQIDANRNSFGNW